MFKLKTKKFKKYKGKTVKPKCGACFHPGYKNIGGLYDGRPRYQCDKRGHTWSCGLSGGIYAGHEMNKDE